jgi:tetratricopeptide (TPR) repeat protein
MKQSKLHHSRVSTHKFLLYKTDAPKKDNKEPKKDIEGTPPVVSEILKNEFPDILVGDAFVAQAMIDLSSREKFCAMALQMDPFEPKPGTTHNDQAKAVVCDIAKTVEAFCKKHQGLWGVAECNQIGAFFPESNGINPKKLAERIQKKLSEKRPETITIGIATFPLTNFGKDQTLKNASKAVDHACFFGPGASALFDAVSLNISGDQLYQKGDVNGAVKEFENALLIDPKEVNVHNSLGVCHAVKKDYESALKAFKTAADLNPDEVMAIYNMGLVNKLTENREKALELFLKAGKISQDIFDVMFQTGRLYLEMKQPENAKDYLEKAIDLKPDSGAVLRFLGDCYADIDMTKDAIDAYKKAIKNNPHDATSLSNMGYLFEITGENPDIALMFCEQSVDISPEEGLFRHRLGRLYFKQNRHQEALKEFERARDLGHDSSEFIEKIQVSIQEV